LNFDQLEKSLKEAITTATTRSYAQVAAQPMMPDASRSKEVQQRNLEHKVQQRLEENKLNVTLSAKNAGPDTKNQLTNQTFAEITANLQRAVENQMEDSPIIIQGVQRLRSGDIRVHCNTEKEAEKLRKLKWSESYSGLTVRQPKFGIVIPGVPTDLIDPNDLQDSELLKQLELQNEGLQVAGAKLLRRKLRESATDFSLVVFLTSPDMADKCIKHGIYIDHQRFRAEKYAPQFQLVQCFKCQRFGHHATKCRSLHNVCAKCSEHHPTAECKNETHKCAGCEGEHPAWHQSCPCKIKAIQDIVARKREASAYFIPPVHIINEY
jgi:hypothetical protein